MNRVIFELCAETLDACLLAKAAGVDRIELCSRLDVSGLTPAESLIRAVVERSGVPVHVMLRAREGEFTASPAEFEAMQASLEEARRLGARGVVFGLLHPDRTVDVERTRELAGLAAGMSVTFHRAFDETPDLMVAMEEILRAGCDRILTSGAAPDAVEGAPMLARLVGRAAGRIDIAVAGGLRKENAGVIAELTGARHFHSSVRRPDGTGPGSAEEIREVVEALRVLPDGGPARSVGVHAPF